MVALEPHGPSSHRSTHTTAYDMVAWSILSYSCISCVLAFSQLAIVLNGTACTTGSWPANVTISSAPLIASILLLRDFFYVAKCSWFSSPPDNRAGGELGETAMASCQTPCSDSAVVAGGPKKESSGVCAEASCQEHEPLVHEV
jgi:hypothetical protein